MPRKRQVLEWKIHHCLPFCQAERQAPGLLVLSRERRCEAARAKREVLHGSSSSSGEWTVWEQIPSTIMCSISFSSNSFLTAFVLNDIRKTHYPMVCISIYVTRISFIHSNLTLVILNNLIKLLLTKFAQYVHWQCGYLFDLPWHTNLIFPDNKSYKWLFLSCTARCLIFSVGFIMYTFLQYRTTAVSAVVEMGWIEDSHHSN